MPIKITCLCKKIFQVPDALAGKRIKCAKCGRTHRVPSEKPSRENQDEAYRTAQEAESKSAAQSSSAICPSCGTAITTEAVICITCGFDRRTGVQRERAASVAPSIWVRKIEKKSQRSDLFRRSSVHGPGWLGAMFAFGFFLVNPAIAIVYSDPNRKEAIPTPDMIEGRGVLMCVFATAVLLMIGGAIWLEEAMINLSTQKRIKPKDVESFRTMYSAQMLLTLLGAIGFVVVFVVVFVHGVEGGAKKEPQRKASFESMSDLPGLAAISGSVAGVLDGSPSALT